jgi:signal transduction histidine kinase
MRLQDLKHLDTALEAFAACDNVDMLLAALFTHIRALFHMEAAFVWLAIDGEQLHFYRAEGVLAPLAARFQPVKISMSAERTIARRLHKLGYGTVLAAPLGLHGKMVGMIAAGSQRCRRVSRIEAAIFHLLVRSAGNTLARWQFPPSCAGEEVRWPATLSTDLEGQQARMHLLNVFASGIIHDLNNAMAVINGRVELLLRSLHGQRVVRHLMAAQHAAAEANQMIHHIHSFMGSEPEGGMVLVDINQLVSDSLQIARSRWFQAFHQRPTPVDLGADLQPLPALPGRGADLRIALLCLLRHAMDTLRPGGRLMVRTAAVGEAEAQRVVISIAEDPGQSCTRVHEEGIGILLRQALTPESQLALEFVQMTVRHLDGQITVDRSGDGATATTLTFPVDRASARAD